MGCPSRYRTGWNVSHLNEELEMTRRYRKEHDLLGYEADDLIQVYDSLTEEDIWQYRYPNEKEMESIGVQGDLFRKLYKMGSIIQHKKW